MSPERCSFKGLIPELQIPTLLNWVLFILKVGLWINKLFTTFDYYYLFMTNGVLWFIELRHHRVN